MCLCQFIRFVLFIIFKVIRQIQRLIIIKRHNPINISQAMGYKNDQLQLTNKHKKKTSVFSCYSNLFNEIKKLKCDFFIKRILFKSLVSMIESQNQQNSISWLSVIEEWKGLCQSSEEEEQLDSLIRRMKVFFVDREISDNNQQKSDNTGRHNLSVISKLLFARYFLGMLQNEQQQHMTAHRMQNGQQNHQGALFFLHRNNRDNNETINQNNQVFTHNNNANNPNQI